MKYFTLNNVWKKCSFLTFCFFLFFNCAKSQVIICKIKYFYDNAGNRIQRLHECSIDDDFSGERTGVINAENNNPNVEKEQNEIENKQVKAKLFPNPTSGFMTLDIECEYTTANMVFYLFDPLGKLLSTFNVSKGINSIDISTLLSGNYVATISIENENFDWQIIKQ